MDGGVLAGPYFEISIVNDPFGATVSIFCFFPVAWIGVVSVAKALKMVQL